MCSLAALLILTAFPTGASTYVLMSDSDLYDQSPIIAEVSLEAILPPTLGDATYTDYQIRVERLLRGSLQGSTQVLRLLGGVRWDGSVRVIPGMPQFFAGERALLFLERRPDGELGIVQLALGAFHERIAGGRRLAVRDFFGAAVLPNGARSAPTEDSSAPERARNFDAFARWIADRTAGVDRPADYLREPVADLSLEPPAARRLSGRYLLAGSKWCQFDDTPLPVTWRAHQGGLTGATSDELTDFQNALQAWEDDPTSDIDHTYGGTTAATGGLAAMDGVNAILWDDPNGEIGGAYSCIAGGVLAIGGWSSFGLCASGESAIQEGDVVTQDGAACFFNGSGGKNGEEVYGHEVGHALGLRHSCGDMASGPCDGDPPGDDAALMRAAAHGDGRGAMLTADDRNAVNDLYRDGGLIYSDGFESGDTSVWMP